MIFDSGYDKTLWCIVRTDRKNNKAIVDFIKELPDEFIGKIRDGIKEFNENVEKIGDDIDCDDMPDVYADCSVGNNIYSFTVTYDGLSLRKEVLNETYGHYDVDLELTISDHAKDVSDMRAFEEDSLGYARISTIDKSKKETGFIFNYEEPEYYIRKLPIGSVLTYSKEFFDERLNMMLIGNFINEKKIPDDITKENLDCKRRILKKS